MRRPPPIIALPLFPVTGGTILLAIGVNIAYWAKIDISPILEDGNVRRWQLWRFLTSALPHADPFHLIFNLYWVWAFGSLLEEVLGHLVTALIFVLLALGSGAAEFAFLNGGIGLSGVGYGLFGILWVLSRKDLRFEDAVDDNTTRLFVIWFFLCIVLTVTNIMPIANIAHGMGALLGYLLGWIIARRSTNRPAAIAGLAVVVIASVLAATLARPWINLSKDSYHAEFQLGYDALQANQAEKSIRWFTDVTRMAPSTPEAWYDLALAYERLGRNDEARAAAERAYQLNPKDEMTRQLWKDFQPKSRAQTQNTQ